MPITAQPNQILLLVIEVSGFVRVVYLNNNESTTWSDENSVPNCRSGTNCCLFR